MFEKIARKDAQTSAPASASSHITCPRCDYTRTVNDTVPAWQCPGCGVAYNKINPSGALKSSTRNSYLRSGINKFRETSFSQQIKSLELKTLLLGFPGVLALLNGLPSEACVCNGVVQAAQAANPLLLIIGAAITGYAALYYFRQRLRLKKDRDIQHG